MDILDNIFGTAKQDHNLKTFEIVKETNRAILISKRILKDIPKRISTFEEFESLCQYVRDEAKNRLVSDYLVTGKFINLHPTAAVGMAKARIHISIDCTIVGEATMEHTIRDNTWKLCTIGSYGKVKWIS